MWEAVTRLQEAATACATTATWTLPDGELLACLDAVHAAEQTLQKAKEAAAQLRAAADRIPHDSVVQTCLGQALWHAGQPKAAMAILSGVLGRDGGDLDALRSRGEYLARLTLSPVGNQTDLKGRYDFVLDLSREELVALARADR